MNPLRHLVGATVLALCSAGVFAQAPDYQLKARAVAKDTWVIEGANEDFSRQNGCNIINTGFIVTSAGTLVINTGPSRQYGEQQRRLIQRTTSQPVVAVFNLNLHPDYFFGNQAWVDVPSFALPGSRRGMQAEGGAYADNLYKLCGDWMLGTESTPAALPLEPATRQWGDHQIVLKRLHGHTSDDLVLLDKSTGVVFAGGLVFANRAPTTPHADVAAWLDSLRRLEKEMADLPASVVVPSHGPVDQGRAGLTQTRRYITWLDAALRTAALQGLDLVEAMQLPLPAEFRGFAALEAEFPRSVVHLYPAYEKKALAGDLQK